MSEKKQTGVDKHNQLQQHEKRHRVYKLFSQAGKNPKRKRSGTIPEKDGGCSR